MMEHIFNMPILSPDYGINPILGAWCDVHNLIFGTGMRSFDKSLLNTFTNQVTTNINVLSTLMKNRATCNMHSGEYHNTEMWACEGKYENP